MNKINKDNSGKDLSNLIVKQKYYTDAILEEDWSNLIDKHTLRYEIWEILEIFHELNVTEITRLVKQSKSTVSRILKGMEEDKLLLSRRGKIGERDGEKIPPKFYRINKKSRSRLNLEIEQIGIPKSYEELRKFYESQIRNYRNYIYNQQKLLDLLNPLLNIFEGQLEDINKAKHIYNTYLSGKNEPWFNVMYFDEEHFEQFLDLRLEYMLKLEKLAREQELNTNNAYVYLDASLPLKAIFELKKDMSLKSK